jgi:hypothetical protein
MVLQKLGEYYTTINVNGNQKVSTTQADDATYNITDNQSVDINVNGAGIGSFTQTNGGTYDISTSTQVPSSFNWNRIFHDYMSDDYDNFYEVGTFTVTSSYHDLYWKVTCDVVYGGSFGDWEIRDSSGNTVSSGNFDDGDNKEAKYTFIEGFFDGTNTGTYSIHLNSFQGGNQSVEVYVSVAEYEKVVLENGPQVFPPGEQTVDSVSQS